MPVKAPVPGDEFLDLEAQMSVVSVEREIDAPVPKVWAALSDFGGVHRYHSAVERSPINEGTPSSGVGSERTCHLYDGNHVQERVTESVPEQKLSVEIFETSMPLKSAVGTFTLSPTPSGGTQVELSMDYVVKYGPAGKLMDVLMVKRMLTPNLNRMLAGLDHHLETGETVEEGWAPAQPVRAAA